MLPKILKTGEIEKAIASPRWNLTASRKARLVRHTTTLEAWVINAKCIWIGEISHRRRSGRFFKSLYLLRDMNDTNSLPSQV